MGGLLAPSSFPTLLVPRSASEALVELELDPDCEPTPGIDPEPGIGIKPWIVFDPEPGIDIDPTIESELVGIETTGTR
jgi:hypothetical protein